MLVLSPKQTDGFHLTLASLPTEQRIQLEALLPDVMLAAIAAAPHWDFELCSKKVDEVIGTTPDDAETGHLRRALIATWLLELPRRIASYNLPPEVYEAFPLWLDRLSEELSTGRGPYDPDHWAKDVRFASSLSVPGSRTHLIDLTSPIGPGQPLRHVTGGHGFAPPFRWLLARGWREWLEVHTDNRDVSDFSPEGWNQTWLAIAGLLERYPGLVGGFGSSWFYDPPLAKISPRLAYLREVPLKHGAFLVHQGTGEIHTQRAAAKSATRRAMIESGEYTARSWLLVWPRRQLLKWAAAERARQIRVEAIIEAAEETGAIVSPA